VKVLNDIQLLTVLINVTDELASGRKSEADNTSSYSDSSQWKIHPEFLKGARTTLLSVMTCTFLGLNPIQELDLKEKILKICHKRNYQGEWKTVKEILTEIPYTPPSVFMHYFKNHSTEQLFGNDLKVMKRIWKSLKSVNPYAPSMKPVKYPKRKRGYDDKGHLSGDSHGAKISVPDNRERLNLEEVQNTNTLWFNDLAGNKEQQGTIGGETTSRKGGSENERKTNKTSNRNGRREDRKTQVAQKISPRFNWRNSGGQAIILASFVEMNAMLLKKNINLGNHPEFLFFYIALIHDRDLKFFGLPPKVLFLKRKEILRATVPLDRPIGSIPIEEIKSYFNHIR
jgi:hypothetical protein